MIRKPLLDRFEEGAVHNRWLLAGQDLTLISDLADIEPIAQRSVIVEAGIPPWLLICSLRDLTTTSSMSVAGRRVTDPTFAVLASP